MLKTFFETFYNNLILVRKFFFSFSSLMIGRRKFVILKYGKILLRNRP